MAMRRTAAEAIPLERIPAPRPASRRCRAQRNAKHAQSLATPTPRTVQPFIVGDNRSRVRRVLREPTPLPLRRPEEAPDLAVPQPGVAAVLAEQGLVAALLADAAAREIEDAVHGGE